MLTVAMPVWIGSGARLRSLITTEISGELEIGDACYVECAIADGLRPICNVNGEKLLER
jgi:hypothetical protein